MSEGDELYARGNLTWTGQRQSPHDQRDRSPVNEARSTLRRQPSSTVGEAASTFSEGANTLRRTALSRRMVFADDRGWNPDGVQADGFALFRPLPERVEHDDP
jgi:hypothetical protein